MFILDLGAECYVSCLLSVEPETTKSTLSANHDDLSWREKQKFVKWHFLMINMETTIKSQFREPQGLSSGLTATGIPPGPPPGGRPPSVHETPEYHR